MKTIQINFDVIENFKNSEITKKEASAIVRVSELKKSLSALKLKSSTELPILDNVLITFEEGKLRLFRTDLENKISISLYAETKGAGSCSVDFAQLSDYLNALRDGSIVLSVDFETNSLVLVRDNSRIKLSGSDVEEYPQNADIQFVPLLTMPSSLFFQGIEKTLPFVGSHDLRPIMHNICIETSPEGLCFVATDANKVSIFSVRNSEDYSFLQEDNFVILFGSIGASLLQKLLKCETGIIKVFLSEFNIKFTFQNVELVCRIPEGNYVNWRAVMPQENKNVLRVNKKELVEVVGRVKTSANKANNAVTFSLNGVCEISASDLDRDIESAELVKDHVYSGEDMKIVFNAKFLTDVLKSVDADRISFLMGASNRGALIMPSEYNRLTSHLLLVMPVLMQA